MGSAAEVPGAEGLRGGGAGVRQRGHDPGHGGDGAAGIVYDRGAHASQQRRRGMVLRDRSPWHEVAPERSGSKDPVPLIVKDLEVEGRRYVVCLNEEETRMTGPPSWSPCKKSYKEQTKVLWATRTSGGFRKPEGGDILPSIRS